MAVWLWWFWVLWGLRVVWGVGVNWGSLSSNPLPPAIVVNVLLANNVSKVKLDDADPLALEALSGTGIRVMVGIPNSMLKALNSSKLAASAWVHDNITRYQSKTGGVIIESIAIGDEPFLQIYKGQFQPYVVGAAINIQLALVKARLETRVKVVVPCNADAYLSNPSGLPSKGHFRPDLNSTMLQLLSFLSKNRSPFVINLYPFLNVYQNKSFPIDYAIFRPSSHHLKDGKSTYGNYLDQSIDTLITALSNLGFGKMEVLIGKIGWPTDGSRNATSANARAFLQGLKDHLKSKSGTPLRPNRTIVEEFYILSLLDENERKLINGGFERHWGVFTFDGQAKYQVDLGQGSRDLVNSKGVEYMSLKWCVVNNNKDISNVSAKVQEACAEADCTALLDGGSCFGLGWPGNASYAFNSYYQAWNQTSEGCNFDGLGLITTVDPSVGQCRFPVGLNESRAIASMCNMFLAAMLMAVAFYLISFES
ncbi:hypothetical protein AMTRI_Chr08g208240 [Amborella trichopoda]